MSLTYTLVASHRTHSGSPFSDVLGAGNYFAQGMGSGGAGGGGLIESISDYGGRAAQFAGIDFTLATTTTLTSTIPAGAVAAGNGPVNGSNMTLKNGATTILQCNGAGSNFSNAGALFSFGGGTLGGAPSDDSSNEGGGGHGPPGSAGLGTQGAAGLDAPDTTNPAGGVQGSNNSAYPAPPVGAGGKGACALGTGATNGTYGGGGGGGSATQNGGNGSDAWLDIYSVTTAAAGVSQSLCLLGCGT